MDLSAKYLQMYQTWAAIVDELEKIPSGWIENRVYGEQTHQYYRCSQGGIRTYNDNADIRNLAEVLEQRKHLKARKKELDQHMKEFRKLLRQEGLDPAQIIKKYKRELKYKSERILLDKKEFKKVFDKKYRENYVYRTDRGEYVASKSEMMIANALFRHGISYEYERELILPEATFHPDFTIFYKGQIYFWEHCGRMDDPGYRERWYRRREIYDANEIYESVNLIVSIETEDQVLTEERIDRIIETHFTTRS